MENNIGSKFLDFGCGNGWVADKLSYNSSCSFSMGIDGAKTMIMNAEKGKAKPCSYSKISIVLS